MPPPKGLPDGIMQEVRCVLAVHCREVSMVDNADGEKQDAQDLFCEKVFHGTEAHASVLDLLVGGKQPYYEMYDVHPIENNREGNELRTCGDMFELKQMYHCDASKLFKYLEVCVLIKSNI